MHLDGWGENRLVLGIAGKKIHQDLQAVKYDIKQHSFELFRIFFIKQLITAIGNIGLKLYLCLIGIQTYRTFYFSQRLFPWHKDTDVGFSVVGLDHGKFGF